MKIKRLIVLAAYLFFFTTTYVYAQNETNKTKIEENQKPPNISINPLNSKEQLSEGGPIPIPLGLDTTLNTIAETNKTDVKHKNKVKARKGVNNDTSIEADSGININGINKSINLNQTTEAPVSKDISNNIQLNSTSSSTTSTSTTTTSTTTTTPKPTKPHITHSLDEELGNMPKAKPNSVTNTNTEDKNPINNDQAIYSESNNSEGPLNIAMKAQNHPDYIAPVVVTIFAVPLFVALTVFMVRKVRDYWEKRHYRRMDFLIDGMYND